MEYIEKNKDKIKLNFNERCDLLFKYCNEYKCTPTQKTIYENKNIGGWLQHQKSKINSSDDELYKKLSNNNYIKINLDAYLIKKSNQ